MGTECLRDILLLWSCFVTCNAFVAQRAFKAAHAEQYWQKLRSVLAIVLE